LRKSRAAGCREWGDLGGSSDPPDHPWTQEGRIMSIVKVIFVVGD